MLNYEFPPLGGGAANANYYLLKEFAKDKNLKIDLVTSSPDKFKVEKFSDNITIYRLDVGKKNYHFWTMKEILVWSWKANKLVNKLLKENRYNMCHAWFGWPCGIIAYLKKVPYIVALRGSDVPGYSNRLKFLDTFLFKPLSKRVWKKAARVVANSKGLKDLALQTLGREIDIIYNGVDTDDFKPGKKISQKLTLISIGRLIERKGYQYLIPALKGMDVKLQLIMDGNMKEELQEMATGMDVEFLGVQKRPAVIKYLQNADIFVLPSFNEGMSNSLLEALACGMPIITTDVGGSKELIKGNGIIVEKGSVNSLKKAVETYLKEPSLIEQQGMISRQIAEKMSWSNVAEEYRRVYG